MYIGCDTHGDLRVTEPCEEKRVYQERQTITGA